MITQQMIEYIKAAIASGQSREIITLALLQNSWSASDINDAFASIAGLPSVPQPTQSAQLKTPSTAVANTVKYAGFWVRAAALMIDGLFLSLLQFITLYVLSGSGILVVIVFFFIYFSYPTLMITRYHATLGKMAVGLHVERVSGENVSFARAALRELVGKFFSAVTLGIGYLMVVWTGKKQGLHDKIADTVVIENDPNKSKTVWIVLAVIFVFALPIIGIFSSIVLASLNRARSLGYDAVVKSELATVATNAELYYNGAGKGSYSGYCNSSDALSVLASASRAGATDGDTSSYVCNDSTNTWAASVPLRTTGYWCVDSTSVSTTTSSLITNGQVSCLGNGSNNSNVGTSPYTNAKYGFSIMPPTGWQTNENPPVGTVSFVDPNAPTNDVLPYMVVELVSKNLSLDAYTNFIVANSKSADNVQLLGSSKAICVSGACYLIEQKVTTGTTNPIHQLILVTQGNSGQFFVVAGQSADGVWSTYSTSIKNSLLSFTSSGQ